MSTHEHVAPAIPVPLPLPNPPTHDTLASVDPTTGTSAASGTPTGVTTGAVFATGAVAIAGASVSADALQIHPVTAAVNATPGLLSWPAERIAGAPLGYYALTLGVMLLLAGLDALGAVFAKEWTLRQQPLLFFAGLVTFMLLYVVFAHSLHYAELSIVTLGWIVFLQVGLLLLDAMRYGVAYSPGKWVAIALVIGLQGYIVLSPNTT